MPTMLVSPLARARHEPVNLEEVDRALQADGIPVRVVEAADHASFDHDVSHSTVSLAWVPPVLVARVEPTARAILTASRAGRTGYRCALVGRREDALTAAGLLGRRAVWIDPQSTAGYLLPNLFLKTLGLEPQRLFSEQRYAGTYRDALTQVAQGRSDLTAIYTPRAEERAVAARMAELVGEPTAAQLAPFAFTDEVPADALVITSKVDAATADGWARTFLSYGPEHPVMRLLAAERVVRARDGDYRYLRTLGLTRTVER